jgi:hypothetical protein
MMKVNLENSFSREAWLMIVLVGVFVWSMVIDSYINWLDIIYNALGCFVAGITFLFLLNIMDGKRTRLNIGSVLKIVAYVAAIAIGVYLLLPLIITVAGLSLVLLGAIMPIEVLFLVIVLGVVVLCAIVNWGAQNLWRMAKNYTIDYEYQKPSDVAD